MKNTIIAAVAGFVAAASAQGLGQARVVNQCNSVVYLNNTPCTGPQPDPVVLEVGDDWTQTFTELEGGCGWSIKLATDPADFNSAAENILQYEYTFQGGDQPIWYDMSLVNGKTPFQSYQLESSNTETCQPNSSVVFIEPTWPGMQTQCPNDVTITLNLCQGSDQQSSSSSGSSSSAAAPSSSAAATSATSSYVAPASSQSTLQTVASSSASHGYIGSSWTVEEENVVAPSTTAAAVTTSAVVTTATQGNNVVVETNIDYVTQISTVIVTARDVEATEAPKRRHAHGHPHAARA